MIKYTFTLGSVLVAAHSEKLEGYKWKKQYDRGRIVIMDKYEGRSIDPLNFKRYMWEAIHLTIMSNIVYADKIDTLFETHQAAHQVLVAQVMQNLQIPTDWSVLINTPMKIQVGAAYVSVRVDNLVTDAANQYAHYQGNLEEIVISDRHCEGELYQREFMIQTLIHELLHCINLQLGLQKSVWDEENIVNTVATFLTEAYLSLREIVEVPQTTDDANNSKTT